MMKFFTASSHPVVVDGRMTEQQAIEEFCSCFENTSNPHVSKQQFIDAYTNMSAAIQDDD